MDQEKRKQSEIPVRVVSSSSKSGEVGKGDGVEPNRNGENFGSQLRARWRNMFVTRVPEGLRKADWTSEPLLCKKTQEKRGLYFPGSAHTGVNQGSGAKPKGSG